MEKELTPQMICPDYLLEVSLKKDFWQSPQFKKLSAIEQRHARKYIEIGAMYMRDLIAKITNIQISKQYESSESNRTVARPEKALATKDKAGKSVQMLSRHRVANNP